ncbi:MAG: WecB/TagA/CpsF family glycosyltransferase, partial [Janthinobacterium lividum]
QAAVATTAGAQDELGKVLALSGFPIRSTSKEKLAAFLVARMENGRAHGQRVALFFANTNFIVKCRFILQREPDNGLLLVNDGIGLDIAAKLIHGQRFEENLNGTDFTPFLFQAAGRVLRVFMIGARPEVLARAVHHVRQQLGQDVVGSCDGYDGLKSDAGLVERINAAQPDVVLVAMGNPIQEEWILVRQAAIEAPVMIGVGALFDFWAGDKARAPQWIRSARLEWFYRLCLEPRRLLRRYTFDILVFLGHCFKYR